MHLYLTCGVIYFEVSLAFFSHTFISALIISGVLHLKYIYTCTDFIRFVL